MDETPRSTDAKPGSTDAAPESMDATPGLHKALSQRQLRMIAIGGVIGAGLFVGSGVVMGGTGPARSSPTRYPAC